PTPWSPSSAAESGVGQAVLPQRRRTAARPTSVPTWLVIRGVRLAVLAAASRTGTMGHRSGYNRHNGPSSRLSGCDMNLLSVHVNVPMPLHVKEGVEGGLFVPLLSR